MSIDYIGPAGSFGPVTYSLADVLAGRIAADLLRDKYVLIGATAASLGERVASPFVRHTDAHADQHGALMPGVEVLANAVNVILRSRFYTAMGDFGSFFWAAMIAALTLLLLESAQGGREFIKQILVLAGVAALIVFAGRAAFQYALVYPPMVACLVAFGAARHARTAAPVTGGQRPPGCGPGATRGFRRSACPRRSRHSRLLSLGGRRAGHAGARLASQGRGVEGAHP